MITGQAAGSAPNNSGRNSPGGVSQFFACLTPRHSDAAASSGNNVDCCCFLSSNHPQLCSTPAVQQQQTIQPQKMVRTVQPVVEQIQTVSDEEQRRSLAEILAAVTKLGIRDNQKSLERGSSEKASRGTIERLEKEKNETAARLSEHGSTATASIRRLEQDKADLQSNHIASNSTRENAFTASQEASAAVIKRLEDKNADYEKALQMFVPHNFRTDSMSNLEDPDLTQLCQNQKDTVQLVISSDKKGCYEAELALSLALQNAVQLKKAKSQDLGMGVDNCRVAKIARTRGRSG